MKVYIASPFFNEEQLRIVKGIERELEIFNIDYFSPRKEGVIKQMTPEEKREQMPKIYESNVDNIFDCDTMIAVVDWPDTGTIFELGYAACIRERDFDLGVSPRTIVTFSFKQKPVNVMLRYGIDAHAVNFSSLSAILSVLAVNKNIPESMKNFPEVNE